MQSAIRGTGLWLMTRKLLPPVPMLQRLGSRCPRSQHLGLLRKPVRVPFLVPLPCQSRCPFRGLAQAPPMSPPCRLSPTGLIKPLAQNVGVWGVNAADPKPNKTTGRQGRWQRQRFCPPQRRPIITSHHWPPLATTSHYLPPASITNAVVGTSVLCAVPHQGPW